MRVHRIRSFDAYQSHAELIQQEYLERQKYEKSLLPKRAKKFKVRGYSYTAAQSVKFQVSYIHQTQDGLPNWREELVCPVTKLNNRMRASVQLFETECNPYRKSRIYLSEQITHMYKYLVSEYPNVIGSEYLGDDHEPGSCNISGIRHEDLTQLSLGDGSVDFFLSFDCFEHVPEYVKAFKECARVLSDKGTLFFSVPFLFASKENLIRATVSQDGTTHHLLEPEYHGDPMNKNGCLCFQYFGWEMLNELKAAGFRDAYGILYWSKKFSYLGKEQIVFVAKKRSN